MSTLMQRNENDPNNPLYYAPRWLRDGPPSPLSVVPPTKPLGLPPRPTRDEPALPSPTSYEERLEQALAQLPDTATARSMRKSLEPDIVPVPQEFLRDSRRGEALGVAIRSAATAAVSTVVVLGFVMFMPIAMNTTPNSNERTALIVSSGSAATNELMPLGVRVVAPVPGATVSVSGLPAGAMMSTGTQGGNGEWRIPLAELAEAFVIPPIDFAGETKLSLVLRGAEGVALASNTVRHVWTPVRGSFLAAAPTPAPTQTQAPIATPAQTASRTEPGVKSQSVVTPQPVIKPQPAPQTGPQPVDVVRQLDPKEVAGLLRRAEELVAAGDILPARALLQRAAEAGNARAAFVLAGTYDPGALKKFGANGAAPSQELAQAWYQKAKAWGFKEAEPRLETLAISGR